MSCTDAFGNYRVTEKTDITNRVQRFYFVFFTYPYILRRKPCCRKETARDAAAVRCGLKFADIHYKFKSSRAPKARLHIDIPVQNRI